MGFFSWGTGRRTEALRESAAYEFLSTGKLYTGLGGTRCNGVFECGSGFSCVEGQCVQSGVTNCGSEGGCDSGVGCGKGGCSSPVGGSSTCTSSNCGSGSYDADCCGVRYCRFSGNPGSPIPIVNCYCGAPEELTPCNAFCDDYYKNYGEQAAGCTDENTCDECQSCAGGLCTKDTSSSAPCQCNPDSLGDCEQCNEDGTTSTGNNCRNCCTIVNHECPCGVVVDGFGCEDPTAITTPAACNIAQADIGKKCEKLCAQKPDPCEGFCESRQVCYSSGSAPAEPPCPIGSNCEITGIIEGGGQKCYIYRECNTLNVPEECRVAECHCDLDCKSCQICSNQGKCIADPVCPA
jgi:hypothetical protein